MNAISRLVVRLIAGVALASLAASAAVAQGWPARPVKLVVPYAAGGPTDVMSRAVGNHLGEALEIGRAHV